MELKQKISRCFGCADKIFAKYPFNIDRAKEMLLHAFSEDNPLFQVENVVCEHLVSKGCNEKHIAEQIYV